MNATERLRHDLFAVRKELEDEMSRVPEDLANWAPAEGMRTYRGQLLEIGTTERQVLALIETEVKPDWQPLFDDLDSHRTLMDLIGAMQQDRKRTLSSLEHFGDEGLLSAIALPSGWQEWFGSAFVERGNLYRWILQHEYYHLGQVVSYNWARGDDPYKR